jgi:hypothetical protein
VSIGVIVIGGVLGVVWLFLHYGQRQDTTVDVTALESQQQVEVKPPDLSGLCEAACGAVYEIAVPPTENPDD